MSTEKPNKIYAGGTFIKTDEELEVINPFHPQKVRTTYQVSSSELNSVIDTSKKSESAMAQLPTWQRKKILKNISESIQKRQKEFVDTIIFESGKPHKYALGEVKRAIQTFAVAAEEASRIPGEIISLDWQENMPPRDGLVKYFPIGTVAGIAPFNFPLNLVAHKVAPAIAAGCPIIIKPASKTPLTALLLAEIIDQTALPKGAFSVLPCSREVGNQLVEDNRIKLLSFTGSPGVGWEMKKNAGKKKVVLELGGNAGAIVHKDADIKKVVNELMVGGFAYSGQVCIHTQRICIHESLMETFTKSYVEAIEKLQKGDPQLEDCDFSCMIDEKNAKRIENWVYEALEKGAECITGGNRTGSLYAPTLLTNVPKDIQIYKEEAFGPVVILEIYSKIEEAIEIINNSKFGLQASIFTDSQKVVDVCFENLEVGGVIHNASTTFRADHMPYGGVKDSGLGREGVKYAMLDMLEPRILVKDR